MRTGSHANNAKPNGSALAGRRRAGLRDARHRSGAPCAASRALGRTNHVREVLIPTRTGVRLAGSLVEPLSYPEGGRRGTVLGVHGFGADRTEQGLFLALASELSGAGFAVLIYDGRGLGRSEGDFAATRLEEHVEDVVDVSAWFARTTRVDEEHRFAIGFSLGAALLVMAEPLGLRFRAAALLSPALRLRDDMYPRYRDLFSDRDSRPSVPKPGAEQVQVGRAIVDAFARTDLSMAVQGLQHPLLICHGTEDARIPFESTRLLVEDTTHWRVRPRFEPFLGASHSFRPDAEHWTRLQRLLSGWLSNLLSSRTSA